MRRADSRRREYQRRETTKLEEGEGRSQDKERDKQREKEREQSGEGEGQIAGGGDGQNSRKKKGIGMQMEGKDRNSDGKTSLFQDQNSSFFAFDKYENESSFYFVFI